MRRRIFYQSLDLPSLKDGSNRNPNTAVNTTWLTTVKG
jgi:hypothetical protein